MLKQIWKLCRAEWQVRKLRKQQLKLEQVNRMMEQRLTNIQQFQEEALITVIQRGLADAKRMEQFTEQQVS